MWVTVRHENVPELAAKSFINCHAEGVDSVMLRDIPENRLRAFVAHDNHTLWRNSGFIKGMSVAFHPHHCEVTLIPAFGSVFNVTPGYGTNWYRYYQYDSKITGKGAFYNVPLTGILAQPKMELLTGPCAMKAETLHSMFLYHMEPAGWFVLEGKENPKYSPFCYSDADLENLDFSQLYKPMSVDHYIALLKKLNVEII